MHIKKKNVNEKFYKLNYIMPTSYNENKNIWIFKVKTNKIMEMKIICLTENTQLISNEFNKMISDNLTEILLMTYSVL